MVLIPGLPDDLGRECLIRVHCIQFSILACVCKAWKYEVRSQEFRSFRKQRCITQDVIILNETIDDKDKDNNCGLKLVDPETSLSCYVPPIPYFLPRNFFHCYGVASVKLALVALFCRRDSRILYRWDRGIKAYVFDLSSWTWREGAEMPTPRPFPVNCSSDGDNIVYVHGIPREKGFTILEYDVVKDKWRILPDDNRCPRNSNLIFHRGKLYGFSDPPAPAKRGYLTFNVSTWQWDSHESLLPEGCVSVIAGLSDCDGAWYGCDNTNILRAFGESSWQPIAMIPGSGDVFRLKMLKHKLMAVCWDYTVSAYKLYVLDLKKNQWERVEIHEKTSAWTFMSAYCSEI